MNKRILVVEDQPDNRQIIRDMLAPTDYEITEAEDGEQALAAIAKQRPDLILMDIQLPIMDGYTAVSRIKADPALRSIPIIAVTSYALNREEKKRVRRDVMTMSRSRLARANCWRKFAITCNNGPHSFLQRTSDRGPPRGNLNVIFFRAWRGPWHGEDPWSGGNSLHFSVAPPPPGRLRRTRSRRRCQ
jgi:two-component system, cell cycle response regulator DivK